MLACVSLVQGLSLTYSRISGPATYRGGSGVEKLFAEGDHPPSEAFGAFVTAFRAKIARRRLAAGRSLPDLDS